jgi:cytochrome c oxidase subunit 2
MLRDQRRHGGASQAIEALLPGALRPLVRPGMAALLLLVFATLLGGCTTNNPQSTLDPKGFYAREIYDLFVNWLFWPAVVVFFAVEGLLLYSIFRFRARPGDPLPVQLHGNTRLEITWTIIPALILVVILGVTFRTQAVLATPPQGETIRVQVIGHQWWWEFVYPDLGVTTANELHIPVGVPVELELTSADVNHSFWVPHLGGKMDLIGGRINRMTFQADEAGVYSGQCSEFCGIQHAMMRVLSVAESRSEFDAWVRQQRSIPAFSAPAATPAAGAAPATESLVQRGAQVFANGACITCHTVRGTPAQARVGPDLTHFGARRSIAANTLTNTPENLARWLRNPQAVKPGNLMPNLNLSDQDIQALVAYLGSLK